MNTRLLTTPKCPWLCKTMKWDINCKTIDNGGAYVFPLHKVSQMTYCQIIAWVNSVRFSDCHKMHVCH